jgi:hypothetical protein
MSATLSVRDALVTRWPDMAMAARKRMAAGPGFADAMRLLQAEGWDASASVLAEVEELARTGLAPDPWIDGHDLQRLGLRPGPAFGRILHAVYDAQLEGRVASRDEAMALARREADRA